MVPDTSPDFLHSNFQYDSARYEDRRQEDRRQEARLSMQETTHVTLIHKTFTIAAQLTDISGCGFQIHHQSSFLLAPILTVCRSDERILVRTVWESRDPDKMRIGLLREEVYLLRRLSRGHTDALWPLMESHVDLLRKFAFSILHSEADTDDVLQEVMIKVLMRCSQFHPGRSFRAWLMQITRNEALKSLRDARRSGNIAIPDEDEGLDSLPRFHSPCSSPAELAERNELRKVIQEEVAALDIKYRQVFLLRHWLQLEMAEVARQLGIPLDTANTRLHRAHEVLRTRLHPAKARARGTAA
jgi:RNA polymerase sigma-70 factor, ECF subfamily